MLKAPTICIVGALLFVNTKVKQTPFYFLEWGYVHETSYAFREMSHLWMLPTPNNKASLMIL